MLNQGLLFSLLDLLNISISHFVFQFELLNLSLQDSPMVLDLVDFSLNVTLFIDKLLVRSGQHGKSLYLIIKVLLGCLDFLFESVGLFLRALTLSSGDLSLHLLDLELSIVEELLLALFFLFEFINV
jgi:hypothetical protein